MGTSVLRSHDCLRDRLRHDAFSLAASSVRSLTNPNPNLNRNHNQTRRRKLYDGDGSGMVVKGPGANLVMGQVKILKRGEKLSTDDGPNRTELVDSSDEGFDLVLGSTDRLGPDPSSVPVPGFLGKKNGAATSDLRRLLGLD